MYSESGKTNQFTKMLKLTFLPYLTLLLLLTFSSVVAADLDHSNRVNQGPQEYTSKQVNRDYVSYLVVSRKNKEIFAYGSGYGNFTEVAWSPGQKFLAFVENGTKQTFDLTIFKVTKNELTKVKLPDYHLNILGHFGRVQGGGPHQGVQNLKWEKLGDELHLKFMAYGSLDKYADYSDVDNPHSFYKFDVGIEVEEQGQKTSLNKVTNLAKKKPEIGEDAEFSSVIYIKAPAKKVWTAIVNSEVSKKINSVYLTKLELKKGGVITYGTHKEKKLVEGTVLNFKKYKSLTHTYKDMQYLNERASEISYVLSGGPEITVLSVVQKGFKKGSSTDNENELKWAMELSFLKTYLETGKKFRK